MTTSKTNYVGMKFSKSSLTGTEMLDFVVVSQKGNKLQVARVRDGKAASVTFPFSAKNLPCNLPE